MRRREIEVFVSERPDPLLPVPPVGPFPGHPPRRHRLRARRYLLNGMWCEAAHNPYGHTLHIYDRGDMGPETLKAVGTLCAAGLL